MKKTCSWSKKMKEMLGVVLNVDEIEKYMMEKGWTVRKNLDRMELKKEIYKKVGNELYKWVLDGVGCGHRYEGGLYVRMEED